MVIALTVSLLLSDVAMVYFILKFIKLFKSQQTLLHHLTPELNDIRKDILHNKSITELGLKDFEKATTKYVQSQISGLESKIHKEFDLHRKQGKNY
jgi:hypothetical protein|tara:strand:+ start:9668 stop:9955 length:288 start_codon:yes stop_codon:yes gene_type:complete